jgi:predicted nucleic acid-binding protein
VICLLDTNVISHRKAKVPNISVVRFLDSLPEDEGFLSVMTLLEIRAGIEKLEITSSKRAGLERWLEADIRHGFAGRILPITGEISDVAGRMLASEKRARRTPYIPDLLIAATAKVYDMQVATLNRKHFVYLDVPLIDL